MKNTNEIIHEFLDEIIKPNWICVDMTAGRGYDTKKLAELAQQVICFDIQPEAIESTKELTKEYTNIHYILDNHQNINEYIKDFVHLVIYNLGYLPNGNKKIITKKQSTIISLSKIHQLLRNNGYLILTCYPGHAGGKEETEAVKQWLKHHEKQYEIKVYDYPTKNSPICYICKKKEIFQI